MGNGALPHAQQLCQVAYAQLMIEQGTKNTDARAVPKHFKKLGYIVKDFFVRHLHTRAGDKILMCFQLGAAVFRHFRRCG